MAALTDNIEVIEKEGKIESHPMVASDIIYKGAMCVLNAAGNAAPSTGAEAGAKFGGMAWAKVDNSSGAAGDKEVKLQKEGVFLLTGTGFALTDVGSHVWSSDDQTVTKTYAANLPLVGVIEDYESSTQVWVKLITNKSVGDAAVTNPTSPGASYLQAEAVAVRDAVVSILDVLRENELIQG